MSFILESIKQAERERKLGQQAPSISIEYTGANVDEEENYKNKWVLLSLVLFLTAIVVWGATYYFANKDRQYMDQYINQYTNKHVEELSLSEKPDIVKAENYTAPKEIAGLAKHDIAMVPVKSVHTSKLKSVKVIDADEEAPKTEIAKSTKPVETKKENPAQKQMPVVARAQQKTVAKPAVVSNKQELAGIYSDLAKSAKQEVIVSESNINASKIDKQPVIEKDASLNSMDTQNDKHLVEIEAASFVAPEINNIKEINNLVVSNSEPIIQPVVKPIVPEHAVNTGVPSFGELPYDIQEKIPSFNVSVHMFHADPAQRRIRINGSMYKEGKSLQQDLALVEITRYGAVFDYQGHLFRFDVR